MVEFDVFVVQVVVAIGIVLATVLVASGRGDVLPPADVSPPSPLPPADRALAPADLDRARLGVGFRGYRMDEVDELLDRAAVDLAARDERIADLERMLRVSTSANTSTAAVGADRAARPAGLAGAPAAAAMPTAAAPAGDPSYDERPTGVAPESGPVDG